MCRFEGETKWYNTGPKKISSEDYRYLTTNLKYLDFNDTHIDELYKIRTTISSHGDIAAFNVYIENTDVKTTNTIKNIIESQGEYIINYLVNVYGSPFNTLLDNRAELKIVSTVNIGSPKGVKGSKYVWIYEKPNSNVAIDCYEAKIRGFKGNFEDFNIDIERGQTYNGIVECDDNSALFFKPTGCTLQHLVSEKVVECEDIACS